jgi:hypothetical protein
VALAGAWVVVAAMALQMMAWAFQSRFLDGHERACGISVARMAKQVVDGEKGTTSPACSGFRTGACEHTCVIGPRDGVSRA